MERLAETNRKLKAADPWVADMRLYIRKLKHRRSATNPKLKLGSNQFVSYIDPEPMKTETLADTWVLSLDQYKELVTSACFYCGAEPEQRPHGVQMIGHRRNGIDRVDNKIGYTRSNCVSCCTICNRDKRDRSQAGFIEHTRRRYEHLVAKGLITR